LRYPSHGGVLLYPENSAESARGGSFSGLSGALSGMDNSAEIQDPRIAGVRPRLKASGYK
jgi:hypothetical protein